MLNTAFGEQAMGRSQTFQWFSYNDLTPGRNKWYFPSHWLTERLWVSPSLLLCW